MTGEISTGEISLPNRDDVVSYLRKQKLIPMKIEEK